LSQCPPSSFEVSPGWNSQQRSPDLFLGVHYGGSVPASKVMDGLGDAIFAYEMNDEEVSVLIQS
jgi:hypothetical protein